MAKGNKTSASKGKKAAKREAIRKLLGKIIKGKKDVTNLSNRHREFTEALQRAETALGVAKAEFFNVQVVSVETEAEVKELKCFRMDRDWGGSVKVDSGVEEHMTRRLNHKIICAQIPFAYDAKGGREIERAE